MRSSEAFQSPYFSKDDVAHLPAGGTIFTIADVRMETIGSGEREEDKPVLYVHEHAKGLPLNRTNFDMLAAAYGEDSDDWKSHRVELYVDPGVMYGPRKVGGVRVRPAGGASANARLTWPEALERAAAAGLDKDQLVAALKARGKAGYNAARDSGDVLEICEAATAGKPYDANGPDDIPF